MSSDAAGTKQEAACCTDWGAVLEDHLNSGQDTLAAEVVPKVPAAFFDGTDAEGSTALHIAAAKGLLETTSAILSRRDLALACLVAGDAFGRTPLHRAAAVDTTGKVCRLLLRSSPVDADALDVDGWTALDAARCWGFTGAANAVFERMISTYTAREKATAEKAAAAAAKEAEAAEMSPFHIASPKNRVGPSVGSKESSMSWRLDSKDRIGSKDRRALSFSMDAEAEVDPIAEKWTLANEKDEGGRTYLHVAAEAGRPDLVALILERKVFTLADAFDKRRSTALHLAAAAGHLECCRVIVESGRFNAVNARDLCDRTALHLAALRADWRCYGAIARHPRCDPTVPDKTGRSAAEYAAERGLQVVLTVDAYTAEIEL